MASYHEHDVDFKEYTIKDSLEHIIEDILRMQCQIVAFSSYIWNIEYIQKICAMLKRRQPNIIIILGGPEVTYEADYFLKNYQIDYVICGEGEVAFPALLKAIENHEKIDITGVQYLGHISEDVACVPLSYVESLDSPYILPQDQDNMSKRILYFESSRGCPFQCQYCLSSLEKGLRFFSESYLKKQLKLICQSGVKTVKFLDRSFNAVYL